MNAIADITYRVSEKLSDAEMNSLMTASWPDHVSQEFAPILERSLAYVTARADGELIGFVNLAWDGGEHAFLLDTLVRPDLRHHGIGTELVNRAVAAASYRGLKWVHVDFEPHLKNFYSNCGFGHTEAGLVKLR